MVGLGPKGSVLEGDQGGKAAQTRARRPFWGGDQGRKEVLPPEAPEVPEAQNVFSLTEGTSKGSHLGSKRGIHRNTHKA